MRCHKTNPNQTNQTNYMLSRLIGCVTKELVIFSVNILIIPFLRVFKYSVDH